jgi:hypothetical protein
VASSSVRIGRHSRSQAITPEIDLGVWTTITLRRGS